MKPRCDACGRTTFVRELKNGFHICKVCQDTYRAVFRIQRRPCKHLPKKRSKPRRGPMRDPDYVRWMHYKKFCAVAQHVRGGACDPFPFNIDAAHTQNNGMSSKGPDSSRVPLCRKHHREYDAGRKAFEWKYGLDMRKLAAEYYAEYLKEKGN